MYQQKKWAMDWNRPGVSIPAKGQDRDNLSMNGAWTIGCLYGKSAIGNQPHTINSRYIASLNVKGKRLVLLEDNKEKWHNDLNRKTKI